MLSGAWVALTALALMLAATRALGLELPWDLGALALLGSFAVYALDRLRDTSAQDVPKAERRAFLLRHHRALTAGAVATTLGAVVLGLMQPRSVVAILGVVVVLALLHARLQHLPGVKPTYIALAWWLVVVGVPVAHSSAPWSMALEELGPIGLAVLANVLACDAADREAEARWLGAKRTWWLGRLFALTGVLVAVAAPPTFQPLMAIPGVTLLALLPYRPTERYTSWAVDGALLVGAMMAWVWMGWMGA